MKLAGLRLNCFLPAPSRFPASLPLSVLPTRRPSVLEGSAAVRRWTQAVVWPQLGAHWLLTELASLVKMINAVPSQGPGEAFLLIHDCSLLCLLICIWPLSVLVMGSVGLTPSNPRGGSEASVWLGGWGVGVGGQRSSPTQGSRHLTSRALLEKGCVNALGLYLLKL